MAFKKSSKGSILTTSIALLVIGGCHAPFRHASVGTNDFILQLSKMEGSLEPFRCGYYAARQVIHYYNPESDDTDLRAKSLLFPVANDTVSILHFIRDNVDTPVSIKSSGIDELFRTVAAGEPVVAFVPAGAVETSWLHLSSTILYHTIVVVGHSKDETKLFFYSDGKGPYVISREVFTREWERVDNLSIMRTL